MDNPKSGSFTEKTIEVKTVYNNLTQEIIQITVDKLKLVLTEHLKNLENKNNWVTPLSILLTLLLVFATTNFKEALTIKSYTWEAFFLMASLLTFLWLCYAIYKAFKSKSIKDIVECLKSDNIK